MPLDIGTIHPLRPEGIPAGDPFADVPEWSPEPSKAAGPKGDPFADIPEWQPAKPPSAKEGGRDIGQAESAGIGAREGITFGGFPAVHGAIAAGQSDEERKASEEGYAKGEYPSAISEAGALIKGLVRLGFSEKRARKIYDDERETALEEQKSAQQQNPGSYLGGQLAGGVLAPIPGAGAATGLRGGAALGRALKAGGIGGALYGGGTALSEGGDVGDIAQGAGIGGVVGGALGGAVHGLTEAGGAALSRGRDLVQSVINPKALAERKFGDAMRTAERTNTKGIDPEGHYAATDPAGLAQTPVYNIDRGGKTTAEMGRAAANLDPEARRIIGGPLVERDEGRTQRFVDRVRTLMGGSLDRGADRIALEDAGRAANGPRYTAAYAAGNKQIGASQPMQDLMDAPAVQEAMGKALTEGKNRAIKDGVRFIDPPVKMTKDGLVFKTLPNGQKVYPNIQYWDYVQRELRDMAEGSEKSKAALIEGLRRKLNGVLDKEVPEFGAARSGAARFFGAQDAVDAGEKFAKGLDKFRDIRDAKRAIAQFSPPERELFARSTMDTITEALKDKPDWGTIKRLFTSPRALEKIEAAIGPARARELEVSLRAETMAQKTKEAVAGNSTSVQQALDAMGLRTAAHGAVHAVGGVGALAGLEALKEGDVNPKHIMAAAIIYGGYKTGARHIDTRYLRQLAETLMSEDPAIANRAVRAISRSPAAFKALRAGTEAGTRVAAHEFGLAGLTTLGGALYNEVMKGEHHEDNRDDQSVIEHPP